MIGVFFGLGVILAAAAFMTRAYFAGGVFQLIALLFRRAAQLLRYRPVPTFTSSTVSTAPQFDLTLEPDGAPSLQQFRDSLPEQAERYAFTYRAADGFLHEMTAIRLSSGKYDVQLRTIRPYESRPAGGHETHRLTSADGTQRICFAPGAEPRDLPDACRKAVFWALKTEAYIRNGGSWS